MIRGSTPTHNFKHKLDAAIIHKVRVIYSQDDVVVLRKEGSDCIKNGNKISVDLTQEDTLMFKEGTVQIQLRILTTYGKSIPSKIYTVNVYKLLEDEVFV